MLDIKAKDVPKSKFDFRLGSAPDSTQEWRAHGAPQTP